MQSGWFVVLIDTNNGKRIATSTERDGEVLEEVHDFSKLLDCARKYSEKRVIPLFDTDHDEMIEKEW